MAEPCSVVQRTPYGWALALAALLTLGNLWKPLTIDDTFYYFYARQIAAAPLDPYGFTVFWYQRPQPAFSVLCPPLLPYWWALGLHLFGGGPVLWKLWLFPFAALFAAALASLLRRWATGIERPLLCLIILSPIFLPSLNLMLDVPATALALSGLAIFIRAADRQSTRLAVLAGCVVGLAGQMKYTGLVTPVILLAYAGLSRRWRKGLIAVGTALAVFVAWEAFVALQYGESHFLHHARFNPFRPRSRLQFSLPLLVIVGSVGLPILLLVLTALGVRARRIAAMASIGLVGFAFGVGAAGSDTLWLAPNAVSLYPLTAGHLVYAAFGVALLAGLVAVVTRFRGASPGASLRDRESAFLVLWLLLEVAGAFALMPFPAVRRVMSISIVATLLAGRLAARQAVLPERRRLIGGVAAFSAALGAVFALTDWYEAAAQRSAAQRAADRIAAAHSQGTVWYVGHWGFQFYAEQRGMQPVVPGQSELRAGDWLVVPNARVDQQLLVLGGAPLIAEPPIEIADALPTRTIMGFYATVAPLEKLRGPRVSVVVYRVLADFVPAPGL